MTRLLWRLTHPRTARAIDRRLGIERKGAPYGREVLILARAYMAVMVTIRVIA